MKRLAIVLVLALAACGIAQELGRFRHAFRAVDRVELNRRLGKYFLNLDWNTANPDETVVDVMNMVEASQIDN
jgi:hypothetical protein